MNEFDVLVVGGGAAGLSAALVLLRARRTVVVVDAGEPRNAPAAHMHGFLSRDGMAPAEFLAAGRAEVLAYGGVLLSGTVRSIRPDFEAELADGTRLRARRVLLATGLRDVLPDIPGARDRWGKDLLHCPYCHGYEVREQPLGVLGGTPEAVQHALLLRQWSSDVVLFADGQRLSDDGLDALTARGVRVIGEELDGLVIEDDRLVGIQLRTGTVIERAAVFVRAPTVFDGRLLADLGCQTDAAGWPVRDASGRTTCPGVWVAGNAANPRAQVISAAGEGSAAAIAINADLVDEDVATDTTRHHLAA